MGRRTRGEVDLAEGSERGERMLLQRVGELPGLAAGEARKVWSGEANPVLRGKPLERRMKVGGWLEGGPHCPRPSVLETGLSWRREGEGARPTESCRRSGCRPDRLHFTRACLPFIHLRAVRTPQRMGLGLDPSVLPSLYRLEDITEQLLEIETNFSELILPFDFLFIRSTGFPPNLGTILNFSEAKDPRAQSYCSKERVSVIVWFCLHWLTKTSRLMLPF